MFSRQVALKVMSAEVAQQEGFGERFLREAKIASNLNHRNIVHIYDTGEVDGCYFLAMEHLAGGDLTRLVGTALEARDAVRITASVLEALDNASTRGVVHRDIKPANIMFREDGTVTLVDFGIAFQAGVDKRYTPSGAMLGTPHYMSPEQVEGLHVDERSDTYSVGAVLFELLEGRPPFDGDSPFAIASKQRFDPIPRLSKGSDAFQPIIDKAMAKLPDDRFQGASEFLAALSSIDIVPSFAEPRKNLDLLERSSGGTLADETESPSGRLPREATLTREVSQTLPPMRADAGDSGVPRSGRRSRTWAFVASGLVAGAIVIVGAYFAFDPLDPADVGVPPEKKKGADIAVKVPPAQMQSAVDDEVLRLTNLIEYLEPSSKQELLGEIEVEVSRIEATEPGLTPEGVTLELKLLRTRIVSSLKRAPRIFQAGSTEEQIDDAFRQCQKVIPQCRRSWYATERIRETVLDPFRFDTTETSMEEFETFVEETGYQTDAEQRGYSYRYGRDDLIRVSGLSWRKAPGSEGRGGTYPVGHLSARDASEYCQWKGGRLPTADEWEYASRGPERRIYTWGDQWDPSMAELRGDSAQPVGSMSQDAFFSGLTEMTGNHWEWVTLPSGGFGLKGGSYVELLPVNLRSAAWRDEEKDKATLADDGVRCAFDVAIWPESRLPG